MSLKLNGFIIDRVIRMVGLDVSTGAPIFIASQVQDFNLEQTADTKDKNDANGSLLRRFYTNKGANITATNAVLDFNILAVQSGSPKQEATESAPLRLKVDRVVGVNEQTRSGVDLGLGSSTELAATVHVFEYTNAGGLGREFTLGSSATATTFALAEGVLTIPTATDVNAYYVVYEVDAKAATLIESVSTDFPDVIELLVTAIGCEECTPNDIIPIRIDVPKITPDPSFQMSLTTDSTFDFTGSVLVDYCGNEKTLWRCYKIDDDEYED